MCHDISSCTSMLNTVHYEYKHAEIGSQNNCRQTKLFMLSIPLHSAYFLLFEIAHRVHSTSVKRKGTKRNWI